MQKTNKQNEWIMSSYVKQQWHLLTNYELPNWLWSLQKMLKYLLQCTQVNDNNFSDILRTVFNLGHSKFMLLCTTWVTTGWCQLSSLHFKFLTIAVSTLQCLSVIQDWICICPGILPNSPAFLNKILKRDWEPIVDDSLLSVFYINTHTKSNFTLIPTPKATVTITFHNLLSGFGNSEDTYFFLASAVVPWNIVQGCNWS